MEPELTRAEAAQSFGLNPRTIDRLIKDGTLPAYRIKGTRVIRIKRSDLETLLVPVLDGAA
jgi:excisionase family DNA binding protein